jgi:hypothetical protein
MRATFLIFAVGIALTATIVDAASARAAAPSGAATYESLEHSFLTLTRRNAPTITHGGPGIWDARQVHYPETIVNPTNPSQLIQFYGGGDYTKNNYAIGFGTANVADPYTWTEYGLNPLVGFNTSVHGNAPVVGPNYVFFNTDDSSYWM